MRPWLLIFFLSFFFFFLLLFTAIKWYMFLVHVLDCKRLLLVKITFVELWPTPHNIPIPTYTHKIWTRTHKSVHNLEINDLSSSSTFLKRTQKKKVLVLLTLFLFHWTVFRVNSELRCKICLWLIRSDLSTLV